jgi:DNA-binding beta-propeller fold protein YncE
MKLCILLMTILMLSSSSVFSATLRLKIFPTSFVVAIDSVVTKAIRAGGNVWLVKVRNGEHHISISAPGYQTKTYTLSLYGSHTIEDKLEKSVSMLVPLGEIACGSNPKSVEFTPDGKFLVSALLGGKGIDVFSVESLKKIKTIEFPASYASKSGFVEIAFVPHRNEMWVSQMTTASVHVIDLPSFT